MNQGIHAVDLLQWMVGLPREVFAWSTRRLHTAIEVEDTVCAALKYPDGALGVIEASTAHLPGWARKIEIGGEWGSAAMEDDRITKWDFKDKLPEDEAIRNAPVDARLGGGAGAPNAITHEGHLRQIQDLVDALRENRPLAVEGKEGRKAVALIRAIYDSAGTGRPVPVS
jgi:predicted dehydrogenase